MRAYSNKTTKKTPYELKNLDRPVQGEELQNEAGNQAALKMLEAIENFNPERGMELALPEELRNRMEARFGMNLSGVKLRESSQVGAMGTKAVAHGDTISFATGTFDPTTQTGREIIGHEMAHVVQQATGKVSPDFGGTDISLDQGLEHAANHEGFMAVMDTGAFMEAQQMPLMPLTSAMTENAPIQGWKWLDNLLMKGKRLFSRGEGDDAHTPAAVPQEAQPSQATVSVPEASQLPPQHNFIGQHRTEASANAAAPEQTTQHGSSTAPAMGSRGVGLPTSQYIRSIAGRYITDLDAEFNGVLGALDEFNSRVDSIRIPSVPATGANMAEFLERLGQANAEVLTTYDNVLERLLAYAEAHSNDADLQKKTLASYAVQYYMIGHSEKIRVQSVYDAMQRVASEESPTGGMADFSTLAGKTFREAVQNMNVFISRGKVKKQVSGGMNTVDFVDVERGGVTGAQGEARKGVLKKGHGRLEVSEAEKTVIDTLIFNLSDADRQTLQQQSYEEIYQNNEFEVARFLIKYRNLSKEELMKRREALFTAEEVFDKRMKKQTNRQGDGDASFDIRDMNTADRDTAVSRINKLLGFGIVTETEMAQTDDRTKSSIAREAKGKTADDTFYYANSAERDDMELWAIMKPIIEYHNERRNISGDMGKTEQEREKARQDLKVGSAQAVDMSNQSTANQFMMLTIIDMIVGHVDRHGGNYLAEKQEDGSARITGIDNDTAFGLFDNITDRSEGAKKIDRRVTPYINESLSTVSRSIYERVSRVTTSMLRGALTGLLSDAEIGFAESRFEKVKAHLDMLESTGKIEEPTAQGVATLAANVHDGAADDNYFAAAVKRSKEVIGGLSSGVYMELLRTLGYKDLAEFKLYIKQLKASGLDPLELLRQKRDFTKAIADEALKSVAH